MPDAKTGTDVRFGDSWASVLLDLVRGVAAVLVLLSHWKLMFFVDYPKIPGIRWPFAVPYLLCDAGHQAVIIFFVLSGYLISGSVFRMLARRQWSWLTYLIHRLTRLWVVLLPGLALGALLDWVGLFYSRCPGLYNVSDKGHGLYVPAQLTWRAFWGNVFFSSDWGFRTLDRMLRCGVWRTSSGTTCCFRLDCWRFGASSRGGSGRSGWQWAWGWRGRCGSRCCRCLRFGLQERHWTSFRGCESAMPCDGWLRWCTWLA